MRGSISRWGPVLQAARGLEDSQVLAYPGGWLEHIASVLEAELLPRGSGPESFIAHCLASSPHLLPTVRTQCEDFKSITDDDLRSFAAAGPDLQSGTAEQKRKHAIIRSMCWAVTAAGKRPAPPPGSPFWAARDIAYMQGNSFVQLVLWNANEISKMIKQDAPPPPP